MNMFTDMFKANPQDSNTNPNAPVIQTKALSDPNPTPDATGKMPDGSGVPVNPLDAYNKMYENANKNSDIAAPSFKIDPKVLGDVSKSMDFTKAVDPALMEKALAGDAKSLLAVMQSVAQNSYSASLEHATALTETHLGQRAEYENKRIDKGVREQLTSSALSTVPNYSHPVVKAELNRVASMFASANPDASPAQIAQAAQKHLQDLSNALSPVKSEEQKLQDSGQMDWTKYLQ
jgi:hypothetical protein